MAVELLKNNGPQNISKNVAGKGTKIHAIVGKQGIVQVCITGAGVHDSKPAIEMLYSLNLNEISTFVADKAYDTNKIHDILKYYKIQACIPPYKNRKQFSYFDKTMYKWRHRVENLFQRIKENRRLSMRYEKLDSTFLGFIAISLIKLEVC